MDDTTLPSRTAVDRDRLSGLFEFAEGLLSAKDKALMTMKSTGLGYFPESRLVGLPGLQFDGQSDVWLQLQRLRETAPPTPLDAHLEWFKDRIDRPATPPSLHEILVRDVDIGTASELCEGGIVDSEEIDTLADPSQVRVVIRLQRLDAWRAQLETWIAGPWETWAVEERPRRLSIALYNQLYQLHNQMNGGAVAPPELVWGIGIATWRTEEAVVDMPVLEQLVDIEVEEGGAICIVPRSTRIAVTLRPFLELDVDRAAVTQAHLQEQLGLLLGEDDPEIDPFQVSRWEHLLKAAATRLSADAQHVSREQVLDGEIPEEPTSILTVRSSWTIYGRPRSENARLQDLAQLRSAIESVGDDEDLPAGLRGFVSTRSDDRDSDADDWGLTRDLGTAASSRSGGFSDKPQDRPTGDAFATGESAYFFPLAYNEEQARIIDRLETEAVVTVTGPPGTGKTHTIANIVSHYMAVGKRVLVTARTAEAIAAVREKLPQDLASLVIASVGSDKDGNAQLQTAIERLSAEVVSLDVQRMRDEKDRQEASILADDRSLHDLDTQLASIAKANLGQLSWQGQSGTPMEMLERLDAIASDVAWFNDRPTDDYPNDLSDTVEALRTVLPALGQDLELAGVDLPDVAELPGTPALIDAHRVERAHRSRPDEDFGDQPPMDRSRSNADEEARVVKKLLTKAARNHGTVADWVRTLWSDGVTAKLAGRPQPAAFAAATDAFRQVGSTELREVSVALGDVDRVELDAAIERGCRGARAAPMFGTMFKSALVGTLDSIRVDGVAPVETSQWRAVADHLAATSLVARVYALWDEPCRAGQLPPLPTERAEVLDAVREVADRLPQVERAVDKLALQAQVLESLFPAGLAVRRHLGELDFIPLVKALSANIVDDFRTPEAIVQLRKMGERHPGRPFAMISALADALGSDALSDADIVNRRNELASELSRVQTLASSLTDATRRLNRLSGAGAPKLVERLRLDPGSIDELLPLDWQVAWDWAVARQRVENVIALGNGDGIRQQQAELKRRRERVFEELIRTRTLLGLKRRMTPSVQTALKMFTAAVTKLGKGTGKSAPKWRRAIRAASMEAAPAAPVWILPEYKIAEQLAPEIGDFDLVILDEASQSDLTSIGSLARGARQLIVGDEKQVSPSSVGIPQNKVAVLVATHLRGLPNAEVIDQETSIFDFAMQMHPTTHLMLREHFRCVEPIIGFSARFYNGRLVPLRIAKPSERIDPPLVDIHVRGAIRKGKTNVAEATVIVEEIAALIANPAYVNRSIAVISLIGGEQAELIERRLMEDPRIGTRLIDRHRILCGDSRTMQGQESDIVFLSMVATPDTVVSDSKVQTAQRLNVALSRARDCMYLVRSVALDDLKTGDLKRAVLEHFTDPMPEGRRIAGTDILVRCESGFEREVCGRLLDANYRVRAQVAAGPYRIDLVVEGAEDRRLAIELDGDRWHGPDRWHDDMVRQAALERAGWTFWRVFGTQWLADRAHWWNDLTSTLETMGIEPIGAREVSDVFTEFREVTAADETLEPFSGLEDTDLAADEPNRFDSELIESANPRADDISADAVILDDERSPLAVHLDLGKSSSDDSEGIRTLTAESETFDDSAADDLLEIEITDDELEFDIESDDQAKEVEFADDVTGYDEQESNVDGSLPLHDEDYRPALARRVRTLVADSGPVDLTALCRVVVEEHGLRRVGHQIRAAVRAAASVHLIVIDSPYPDHTTVWPEGSEPTESLPWNTSAPSDAPEWDALCWPAQVGLLAHVLSERPEDLQRAVLEHVANRSLTRRLASEIDRVAAVARRVVAPLASTENDEPTNAAPVVFDREPTSVSDSDPQVRPRAFNDARLCDRSVDELIGLCRGVLADGSVSQGEAEFLLDWLQANRATATHWPASVLYQRISLMLEDGVLDSEEGGELLQTLLQVTGDPDAFQRGEQAPSSLPLCRPVPYVNLAGQSFCLTGTFISGSRATVTELIEQAGGRCVSAVSGKLDYLVIGSIGSAEWMHSTHGRKIEKAVALKSTGGQPRIVDEQTLVAALQAAR